MCFGVYCVLLSVSAAKTIVVVNMCKVIIIIIIIIIVTMWSELVTNFTYFFMHTLYY